MAVSNKPVIWALFAAGGTLAAFVVPVLVVITCLAVPFGLSSGEGLHYDRLLELLQHPLNKLFTFGVLFPIGWHAAHRMRITAHDLGIGNDTLVALICYSIAASASLLLLAALFRF